VKFLVNEEAVHEGGAWISSLNGGNESRCEGRFSFLEEQAGCKRKEGEDRGLSESVLA